MTSKAPAPPPDYKPNIHAIPGDRLVIMGDLSEGSRAVYVHVDDLLRMLDAMVVEGHNQIANRMMGRTGSEQMPIDDTQIGIEFAEGYLRKRIEKYGR